MGCGVFVWMLTAIAAISSEPVNTPVVGHCTEFHLSSVEAQAQNPYDPDEIRLDILLTAPGGGSLTIPCFWKQAYRREIVENQERRTISGAPGWCWRYTPATPGEYRWVVKQSLQKGEATPVGEGAFQVAPPEKEGVYHGYARVENRERHGFQYDDGAPLLLYGANLCWSSGRGTYDYDDWLPEMAVAGMNYSRLWMAPFAFGIEARPGELTQYNQESAWMLDYVLELAASKGMVLMLCLDYHGMFQDTPDAWGGNDFWPKHPYFKGNGGPCAKQNDFFTMPEARALYEKRLRYLVGRYGAYPSLFCWEFFNEINLVYNRTKFNDVRQWHDRMAGFLKSIDPWKHPVTTSFSGSWEDKPMWKLPSMDFAQYHLYMEQSSKRQGGVPSLLGKVTDRFTKEYDKPLIIGEYGVSSKGNGQEEDPYYRGLRQGIWGAVMAGSAGTVMPWWWDYLSAQKAWGRWTAVKNFAAAAGIDSLSWKACPASASGVTVRALHNGVKAALYVVDSRYEYPTGATVAEPEHCETTITLSGLTAEKYRVFWWDDAIGATRYEGTAVRKGDGISLATPSFTVDAAAWLIPE